MADLQTLERALRNADSAGDIIAARIIAAEIKKLSLSPDGAQPSGNVTQFDLMTSQADHPSQSAQGQFDQLPWYAKPLVAADDLATVGGDAATFGYGAKAAAGLRSMFTGKSYQDELARNRAMIDAARERAGSAGLVTSVASQMVPVGKAMQMGATVTKLVPSALSGVGGFLARAGANAVDGAALGAINAKGYDEDVLSGATMGSIFGAGGSAIGDILSSGASKIAGLLNPKIKTMSPEDLRSAGNEAFQRAKDAGVVYKPEAIQRLAGEVKNDFAESGYHPANQPGAGVALSELERLAAGGNVDLQGLHSARRIAQGGFRPDNPSNNMLLGRTTDKIDNFIENISPGDVLMGDAAAGAQAQRQGIDLWRRLKKTEQVDKLLERAQLRAGSTGSGGNVENATRSELRRILTDKKFQRGFTADEKEAVRRAVLGTPTQNALRLAGKLSPAGNGLMMFLQGGAAIGAPYVGIPAMVGGYAAKKAAESMTSRNAAYLRKLIAAGGKKESLLSSKNRLQLLAESKRGPLAKIGLLGLLGSAAGGN